MNPAERAVAYRAALEGHGRDNENALALICAGMPEGIDAEAAWEGALLAEVPAWQLRAVADAGNWPAAAALADLAGEDPWSRVVCVNRMLWAENRAKLSRMPP